MIIFVSVLVITICVSATCLLLEACLLSIIQADIAQLSDGKPYLASVWEHLKSHIQKPIAVILIINAFANTMEQPSPVRCSTICSAPAGCFFIR